MSWEKEVEEIRRRVELAKGMGGAENIKRQHDGGKLTVRERIERLLDAGTFHEYGALAGSPKYEGERLPRSRRRTLSAAPGESTGGASWSAATTSRCAAVRPTRISATSAAMRN